MFKRVRWLAAPFAAALALTGCGGHAPVVAHHAPATAKPVHVCSGTTDTCVTVTPSHLQGAGASASGRIPDVSSFQGHPNWAAAKAAGIAGAIVKAGEFVEDPDFAFNWNALRSLGLWHAPYDFVRFCNAAPFIAWLNSVGYAQDPTAGPPVLDMEVASAAGCAPTMTAQLEAAFHRTPVIYTAPGTWPGGSHAGDPLWIATYGSSFSAIWQPVVAWQCTDGQFGCVTFVPGIGFGDVSVNLGITKLTPVPTKPKADFSIYPLRAIKLFGQKVSERLTVERWWRRGCQNPVKRAVCVTTRRHLEWFAGRLYTLSHRGNVGVWGTPVNWTPFKWGKRFHRIEAILHGSGR